MKAFRRIMYALMLIWVAYIAFIYITGTRVTYLIPKGYEGPLLIVGNQKNGVDIDPDNIIYDFTKSNVLKIKDSIYTGFTPWGYTKYYYLNNDNSRVQIETTDAIEKKQSLGEKEYIWDNFYEIGGCELKKSTKISYEASVLCRPSNIDKCLDQRDSLIQVNTCRLNAK